MATENEIRALKRRYSAKLMEKSNVVGVGVERGEDEGFVLAVHVADDDDVELPDELKNCVRLIRSGRYTKQ